MTKDLNVYVLGAGFSRAARLPLISDFLEMMRDVEGRDNLPAGASLAVRQVLEERASLSAVREKMRLDLDDIEELFSLFDAATPPQAGYKLSASAVAVRRAIAATLSATEREVDERHVDLHRDRVSSFLDAVFGARKLPTDDFRAIARAYDVFAALVSGRLETKPHSDVVITFNYDTVVERALHRAGITTDYGLTHVSYDASVRPGPGSVNLIKLHGSINWAPPKGRGQKMRILPYKETSFEGVDYPLLVPPTWSKGGFAGVFQQLWSSAIKALSKATRIVVVGYSFPATDQYFRYLLATSLRHNHGLRRFVVVDPNASQLNFDSFFDDIYIRSRLNKIDSRAEDFLMEIPRSGTVLGRATAFPR